jgi:1-acyl-sn-glycerol-3-phosphate acyltransferase
MLIVGASVLNWKVFSFFTALTVVLAVPLQILALPWDPERRVAAAVGRWIWGVAMVAAMPHWRVFKTGFERVGPGPWIVVANHQSTLDIPLIMHLPVPVRLMARAGIFEMPVFGQMAQFSRQVRFDGSTRDGAVASLARCRELLGKGISIVVFPEGTRHPDGLLQPFARGAFQLAIDTGADILPVCIDGTRDCVGKGSWLGRRASPRVKLQVLEPLRVDGRSRRELARLAHARIAAALAEPWPDGVLSSTGSRA